MKRLLGLVAVSGCLLAGVGSRRAAADDVGVYVDNPGIAKYVELAVLLRRQLPAAQAHWNDIAGTGATFTIAVEPNGTRFQASRPCDGVPIHVRVAKGQITSARYAISTPACKADAEVQASDDPEVYALLSPSLLFQQVSAALERGVQGQTCVDATFDDDFGLPTILREGCPWVKNADFQIQISDIVSIRQRYLNIAISVAGALLALATLGWYQLLKVRRRQEAMPELLLR